MKQNNYVIGIDYGTDSVRALIVDTSNGEEIASSVFLYPRWKEGLYCNAARNQFRQHPSDYVEGLEAVVRECLEKTSDNVRKNIRGISIATTGSTPVAVDQKGLPLALSDEFKDNPNAMFVLWKDHTAIGEAEHINDISKKFDTNYLKYVGGLYSSEWYWAKLLHLLHTDARVAEKTFTFVEHSDWIPFLLSGGADALQIKRNVCAAGHKGLWANRFNGLPPEAFFEAIDPSLIKFVKRFGNVTYSADKAAGNLCPEWANRLGLSTDVKIGIGAIDAHVGAIGGEIKPHFLNKVIGTSTCDMMIVSKEELGEKEIDGISGQVEDSIVPGYVGLEAGQSAFGDIYSWFRELLLWPLELDSKNETYNSIKDELNDTILEELSRQASQLPLNEVSEFAIDWFNGRRTPNVDPTVKGVIGGLTLGSNPPKIYRALVEATCFGSKAIVESIEKQGIKISGISALGGIATKSKFVIQTLADILNRPVQVLATEQSAALGAAMLASVVCGLHKDVEEAGKTMGKGFKSVIQPQQSSQSYYHRQYELYKRYGAVQKSK